MPLGMQKASGSGAKWPGQTSRASKERMGVAFLPLKGVGYSLSCAETCWKASIIWSE